MKVGIIIDNFSLVVFRFFSNILLSVLIVFAHQAALTQEHISHSLWNKLTHKHVTPEGKVNYKGFKKDEKILDEYLVALSKKHPQKSWKRNVRLAYWINAYNAFTVKLIVKNLPVKSIKELGGSIYKINTAWDIKFIKIGKKVYDLNNIEHGIIRKKYNEPRIHFALNCASISCPALRNEAYVAKKLNSQLDEQTRKFINDGDRNIITSGEVKLSKIFSWFRGDFKEKGKGVIDFINGYSIVKIDKDAKISYLNYDWNLND